MHVFEISLLLLSPQLHKKQLHLNISEKKGRFRRVIPKVNSPFTLAVKFAFLSVILPSLLSLIFAGLNFRDLKNVAKLKSHEKKVPRKLKTRNLVTFIKSFIYTWRLRTLSPEDPFENIEAILIWMLIGSAIELNSASVAYISICLSQLWPEKTFRSMSTTACRMCFIFQQ